MPDGATSGEAGAVAGQIAEWVGGKIGGAAASLAINYAMGYLGLEPGQNVDSQLAEMNAKLDQILSDLDVLNAKVDQLAASLTALTNNVDVGLKHAYAEIAESALVPVFGAIDTKFGKRATASATNLFGIMHLPPSGTRGVAASGNAFVQSRPQFWDKIHSIHYTLTVSAGSSESLIQKWASLIVARMHANGDQTKLGGYASVYEAWFTQAVVYQLKAYSMVMFATGGDTASQSLARQEMSVIIGEECGQYLDGLERLALSVARLPPSGPTANPVEMVDWAPGTQEWLLRADVYTRALISGFDGDTATPLAKKLSGVYGRILLRPSDLTAEGKAPNRGAFIQYENLRKLWPGPQSFGKATLGATTEFQGIDWAPSDDRFGKLKAAGQSQLRFGRYFWPTPARPGGLGKNFEPFPYLVYHYTNFTNWDVVTSDVVGHVTRQYFTNLRLEGRPGAPKYRDDAKVLIYGLADLAPIPLPQRRAIEFGFPFKNPYTVFGKTALFIINWLDSWSGPCNGPTFSPGAAPGYQTTPFNANDPILSCTMTPGWLTPHPLEFNGTQLRSQIEGRAKLGPPLNRFGFEATLRCAWNSPPAPPDWQFRSNVWKVRAGQAGYDVSLFSTAADENGNAQLYLRGRLTSTPIRTVDNDRITMEHTVSLLLISDKGARAELLLFHGQAGDSKADVDIKADFTNIGPLAPNANYRLTVQISTTVVFPYICGDPPPLCSCGTFGQTAAR